MRCKGIRNLSCAKVLKEKKSVLYALLHKYVHMSSGRGESGVN